MSTDDRHRLFGNPTDLLVAEAVWSFHHANDEWPTWREALDEIAELTECDLQEAEDRLLAALKAEEVLALFSDEAEWYVAVDEELDDNITRRYQDLTMKRRDRKEAE